MKEYHTLHGALLDATDDEAAEHAKVLQEIQAESKGKCVWLKLETPGAG